MAEDNNHYIRRHSTKKCKFKNLFFLINIL